MLFGNLSEDIRRKLSACGTAEELVKTAAESGVELSEDALAMVNGGAASFARLRESLANGLADDFARLAKDDPNRLADRMVKSRR